MKLKNRCFTDLSRWDRFAICRLNLAKKLRQIANLSYGPLLATLAMPVFAEDWPNWRGPQYDGISTEALPDILPDELPEIWKTKVGIGFSTVSVSGDFVLTMGNESETDIVWCLDAKSGEVIWKHEYPCPLDPLYFEGGPCATPTVSENCVFTFSRKGHAFCLDLTSGEVLWSRDLLADYEFELPEWSFSSSPVIHENLVLLNAGGAGIALNRETGDTIWKSNSKASGYASAVPFGDRFLLFSFADLVSFAPETGQVDWKIDWPSGRGVNAADPIVSGGQFLISSALGSGLFDLENGKPREIWRNKDLRCYFNAGVLLDGHVYALHGTTHKPTALICLNWKTGETVWSEPGFATGGVVAAAVGNVILFDKGELTIFPASPKGFAPTLRQQVLTGKCWTAPVFANGQIYVRNAKGDLACLSARTP